ncbi:MAG: serine/threonine-protein phosphatase [Candidatus Riflebacteria bacterium]|nr:serine/threonine-protein phosphatase [Candidatus Riflebacteria bacterium]
MGLLEVSHCSDRGMVREQNEDAFLVIPPWREPALSVGACLFAVADGMGGHSSGEVASWLAVDTLRKRFARMTSAECSITFMENLFAEANQAIREHARSHSECTGMGTTLTAAMVMGDQAIIGHVGDSRAYLLRDGKLRHLTSDHTLVFEQLRLGKLTHDEAMIHPARHILSRALGVREFVNVDTLLLELVDGDVVCIMSDGVSGPVSDEKLAQHLSVMPFKGLTGRLVASANQFGGPDNATVVAFRVSGLPITVPGRLSLDRLRGILSEWLK